MEFHDLIWYGILSYAVPFIGTVGFLKMQQRHGMPIDLGTAQVIAALFVIALGALLILTTDVGEFKTLGDFAEAGTLFLMGLTWLAGAGLAALACHFISKPK